LKAGSKARKVYLTAPVAASYTVTRESLPGSDPTAMMPGVCSGVGGGGSTGIGSELVTVPTSVTGSVPVLVPPVLIGVLPSEVVTAPPPEVSVVVPVVVVPVPVPVSVLVVAVVPSPAPPVGMTAAVPPSGSVLLGTVRSSRRVTWGRNLAGRGERFPVRATGPTG